MPSEAASPHPLKRQGKALQQVAEGAVFIIAKHTEAQRKKEPSDKAVAQYFHDITSFL
jgi:hypothetical protein